MIGQPAQKKNEFFAGYIEPQGIQYTLGLVLFDLSNSLRAAIFLDRTIRVPFSRDEKTALSYILPHLKNLYKNFYFNSYADIIRDTDCFALTAREVEITVLLCKGAGPSSIGRKLCISTTTVYKHIANIYGKMNVSSCQELLVKMYAMKPAAESV